jgi:hypothetical protein
MGETVTVHAHASCENNSVAASEAKTVSRRRLQRSYDRHDQTGWTSERLTLDSIAMSPIRRLPPCASVSRAKSSPASTPPLPRSAPGR